jgi:hypothetical protein
MGKITLHVTQSVAVTVYTLDTVYFRYMIVYTLHKSDNKNNNSNNTGYVCGLGSSVGIVTDYGLDGPGIESRWGEIVRKRPDRPWGPPSLLYSRYRVFPRGKAAGAWC